MAKKKNVVFHHVIFWLVYTGIFTFVEGGYSNRFSVAFYIELVFLPFRLFVIYFNFFILLKLLLRKQYLRYIIYTLITIVIASILHRITVYNWVNEILYPDWNQGSFWQLYKFVQSAMIITTPFVFLMSLTIVSKWVSTERKAENLEREKLQAELSYLRSQINPHFFFNTLNNLYGLALRKADSTPEVVLKLSELMSYIIYEADKDSVVLAKEIEQIERYIALEQIRYDNRFEVAMHVEGDVDHFKIPPLILLPFVENSFKHGVNKTSKDGWVAINIDVTETTFHFQIKNKVFSNNPEKNGNNGLGIANVKKRLMLLFEDDHTLKYEKADDVFTVDLVINRSI